MKRLILTNSNGMSLKRSGISDDLISLPIILFRFVWGPLPSPDNLATYLAARSERHGSGEHWSDYVDRRSHRNKARRNLGLVEFCEPYGVIELWFEREPNDQLRLMWVLDCFRSCPEIAARLELRLVDFNLITMHLNGPEEPEDVPIVDVTAAELQIASLCWQAYRSTTPEACFDLLHRDLSAFPLLRPALLDLLQELPWSKTGLAATEMRLLELIGTGFMGTNMLFYLRGFRQRGVFGDMDIGTLLEGLAHGPQPAITGLDDELRVIDRTNQRDRLKAYQRSRLSLTDFGKTVLAHETDFSRHNPIDRWWGGTHLTNDNLWRWNPALMKP
ncbi:hypothetical protein UP10_03940 [Bradyrhizobium sp. LTSPM299]|uniref:hypothetical protein n=1 Tax=Bradyrhizobium sp. LTSPM299 TaxID=1619233 RepID=UPI0005C929C6|nr:hypothetical protein [Bradyrhizobium sp. LTSPM299]KJC62470.1 hypothetical protein UP10_03940 [Bradyrhizobium sp. LTSPM299]